jgi:hypothetical protein
VAAVRCERPVLHEGERRVNCSFDYRYGRNDVRRIATLRLDGDVWRISNTLSVDLSGD